MRIEPPPPPPSPPSDPIQRNPTAYHTPFSFYFETILKIFWQVQLDFSSVSSMKGNESAGERKESSISSLLRWLMCPLGYSRRLSVSAVCVCWPSLYATPLTCKLPLTQWSYTQLKLVWRRRERESVGVIRNGGLDRQLIDVRWKRSSPVKWCNDDDEDFFRWKKG